MNNDEYIKFYGEIKELQKYIEILSVSTSDQASYLKDILSQMGSEEKSHFLNNSHELSEIKDEVNEINDSLKFLNNKVSILKDSTGNLQEKALDKNVDGSLICLVEDINEEVEHISKKIDLIDTLSINSNYKGILEELKKTSKSMAEIQNKKKNWTWIVELLYKIVLTTTVIIGVFGLGKRKRGKN